MNNRNRNAIFLLSNAIIPLFLGLGIYFFMKSGTYINTFFEIDFDYTPKTIIERFIVNWLCDFLWSYSLVFALYFVLSPFKNRLLISCIISALLGLILELLQGVNIMSGTFDWWDILIEFLAVFTATSILIKINHLSHKN